MAGGPVDATGGNGLSRLSRLAAAGLCVVFGEWGLVAPSGGAADVTAPRPLGGALTC